MSGWSRIAVAMALLLSPVAGAAQTSPTNNPGLTAHVRGIDDAAHARALGLDAFKVEVRLRGSVAETSITATFANPLSEVLEGDFRFQLPAGAVVTGYALDIGGKLVDGVLVDRPRARAVYAERVRAGVDPGVAEVRRDGLFETHVFPIPPGGVRTIRLRFVTAIGAAGYALPLMIDAPAHGWAIAVQSTGGTTLPMVTLPDGKPLAANLTADEIVVQSGTTPLAGTLAIATPTVADLLLSRDGRGERDVELGGALPAGATTRTASVRIYWDRARARKDSRHDAEIALVARWLDTVRPQAIELVAFNSSGAQRHSVATGAEAATWLGALTYRGATSLTAIAHDGAADHCLLVGGSAPTIDRDTAFAADCRLDVLSSAPDADTAWLAHLATAHGGHAFSLTEGADPETVLRGLAGGVAGVRAVTDQDGGDLPFVALDAAPGSWRILTRAPEAGPLLVRVGGETRRVAIGDTGDLAVPPFDGVGALIANDQLATLTATERRADFLALSRRYGIASPSLSFLVLEVPEDYLAADVTPPANYPAELRNAYNRAFKALAGESDAAKRERLARVIHDWAKEVTWWKKPFNADARPTRVATSRTFDQTEAYAPPPPPPPPPAPSPMAVPSISTAPAPAAPTAAAAPTGGDNRGYADVVVTAQRRGAPDLARSSGRNGITVVTGSRTRNAPAAAAAIQIDAWQPDRPYLELYDGKPAAFDERFLEAEQRRGDIPAFYLDTAEWLRKHGRASEAAEMVLSALDLPSANEVTLGIVADRLERYGQIDRAVELRTRQAALDPDRPQPKRLLALALARRAALQPASRRNLARADLTRAIRLLGEVAVAPNDARWDGIDMISLVEANALVPKLRALGGTPDLDPRLIALLDTDIRVVVDWTTDASDLDLWVDEPTGERSIYNNPLTAIGGHLSNDMTQGYGPEEYLLRRARAGTYTVHANVFAADRLDPNGASVLTAHLFRNFGRPDQQEQVVDIELTRDSNGAKMIGRIIVPGGTAPAK
ncbi:VIT domain-containing protein [Sphingomonas sp. AR_OL41]|uniref:VIT domain-containing protein n=1 Tax=Sphingomonas sp. AR_OL41 TaxID=3042729 RepID=UPI002480D4F6|nr:VIT domain-containing protein [Sphingomonas sp. AR_OL41]MDH7975620.1 VIT domain-containing protein [Sphingomonas sp. AR_OL41]